tara:strand:- start:156 stop:320 length:165 start_codon:yes stop_codon:yes gene_type:complete
LLLTTILLPEKCQFIVVRQQQVRVHRHDSEKNVQDWPMTFWASTVLFFTEIVLG